MKTKQFGKIIPFSEYPSKHQVEKIKREFKQMCDSYILRTVNISPYLHKRLKRIAINEEITLQELLETIIKSYLSSE